MEEVVGRTATQKPSILQRRTGIRCASHHPTFQYDRCRRDRPRVENEVPLHADYC